MKNTATPLLLLAISLITWNAQAQGTAFTYQGRLADGGAPANGTYDLTFSLRPASTGAELIGNVLTLAPVVVSNGMFTVLLDFGPNVFTNAARWLELGVRTNGSATAHALLTPRQPITPVPFALYALSGPADASAVTTGTLADARLSANIPRLNGPNTFTGAVKATSFLGTGGTLVVGTTGSQPLELKVNGLRALRLEPAVDGFGTAIPNVIGGAANNSIATYGSFIGGGSYNTIQTNAYQSTVGGGNNNTIQTDARGSTIGGGYDNTIQTYAFFSTIGGGQNNTIQPNSLFSTIGGGRNNAIQTNAERSTIGGGDYNTIHPGASVSTIGGGQHNTIQPNAYESTIGGGHYNTIQDNGQHATIPGGLDNSATNYAFAAGRQAKANHTGAFVWADSQGVDFASSAANEFNVRASGGTRIFSNSDLTAGVTLAAGGGAWTTVSDRNAKENFTPVDGMSVLEKVATLPMTTWNYKAQDKSIRHIGPMAQDFKAAFGLGESDTGISTIDTDGVALAAIQGLNQKLEAQAAQAQAKDAQIKTLETRLAELEKLVRALTK